MNIYETKLLLNQRLVNRSLVKVIAGMSNFDKGKVADIIKACQIAKAHAIDVAADREIIQMALDSGLPVFVSATEKDKLKLAIDMGANVIELDYDMMYKEKQYPSAAFILDLAKSAIDIANKKALVSVTIAGTLPLDDQKKLALELQHIGVDIIQTEGIVGAAINSKGTKGFLEAGLDAFTHTMEIRSLVTVPILISGGISSVTAPFAPATGCDGIGVGSAVSKQPDIDSMAKVAQDIISGVKYSKGEGKIII